MKTKLTPAAKRAINNYGEDTCRKAYKLNRVDGEGPYTTGLYCGLTTNQANAAINAGAELVKGE